MKIPDTTPQALEQAMQRFDAELRNTSAWTRWQEDESYKYAIERNGQLYPVKKIVSLATNMPVEDFSGGEQANGYVEKYGFKPIEIPSRSRGIKSNLELILLNYATVSKQEPFGSKSSISPAFKALQNALVNSEVVRKYPQIRIDWSAGIGNWAKIPWLYLHDPRDTDSPKKGIYCVFLFREDMSGVYLTLNQGVQDLNDEKGRAEARRLSHVKAESIRQAVPGLATQGFSLDDGIDLRTGSELGRDYQFSTVAYKLYEKELIPDDESIQGHLDALLKAYSSLIPDNRNKQYWFFQANPEFYDLPGALGQLSEQTWRVSQYRNQIHFGDSAFMWESGADAGILGIATVSCEPREMALADIEKPFVRNAAQFADVEPRVILTVDKVLAPRVTKRDLLKDDVLRNLQIIVNPRGTNFPVTPEQAKSSLVLSK